MLRHRHCCFLPVRDDTASAVARPPTATVTFLFLSFCRHYSPHCSSTPLVHSIHPTLLTYPTPSLHHSPTPLTDSTHPPITCRYGNIIIGPTAEPQKSRDDRSTDAATIAKLRAYGEKILPALRDERQATVIGTYVSVYLQCSLNDIPSGTNCTYQPNVQLRYARNTDW